MATGETMDLLGEGLCRGTTGQLLRERRSPQCQVTLLVSENLPLLSSNFFSYACELLYLLLILHIGRDIDRHRRSSQLHRQQTSLHDSSYSSRLIQGDFIQAHLAEISTEGGPKLLSTPKTSRFVIQRFQMWLSLVFWLTDITEHLLSGLQGLSVSEGLRKLRATPLNLAVKMEIRYGKTSWNGLHNKATCIGLLILLLLHCSPCPLFYQATYFHQCPQKKYFIL